MEVLTKALGAMVLIVGTIAIAALAGGTLLWALWDHIHAIFPTAANSGIIARDLAWNDAVAVAWIFGILIKSTNTNTNN